MTDKEARMALLQMDITAASAAPNAKHTQKILATDRRRVRLLTGMTTLFWLLVVAGLGLLIWQYFKSLSPRLGAYADGHRDFHQDAAVWLTIGNIAVGIVLACIIAMLLGAISMVRLVLTTRRATIRQMNASLFGLSEQLRLLRQASAGS